MMSLGGRQSSLVASLTPYHGRCTGPENWRYQQRNGVAVSLIITPSSVESVQLVGPATNCPPPPSCGAAKPSTFAFVGKAGGGVPVQQVFSSSSVATSTTFGCALLQGRMPPSKATIAIETRNRTSSPPKIA